MAWTIAASLNEVPEGKPLGVEIDGMYIALYNLGGEIYATHGICTHALALLSEGWIEDGKIECPLHQGQFDIRSGKALCSPVTEDLRTFAVRVEGNDILVDVDQPPHCSRTSRPNQRPWKTRIARTTQIVW
jgi:nitrite reductase/ring-hydroxylating ferredoxin subunit